MSKSAMDATRFTSTTPHASARHPVSSSSATSSPSLPRGTPGPTGETAQQRVRRLKEAAARARDAKVSTFDKVIIRGRVWADRAHRFTALTLIGVTGIAGVVTVYALGDMMIYNRRKRREYFAEQQALHFASIYEAQQAIRRGVATEEQLALLQQEESIRQAEEAKIAAKGPGILARVKDLFYSGLKKEQSENTELLLPSTAGSEGVRGQDDVVGAGESVILKAVDETKQKVREEEERVLRKAMEQSGGKLDRLGTSSAAAADEKGSDARSSNEDNPKQGGSWTSFMSRR